MINQYLKEYLPYFSMFSCNPTYLYYCSNLATLPLRVYPTRLFRRILLEHCLSLRRQQAQYAFTDTFQGHYKDGTIGTHDYRVVSGSHVLCLMNITHFSHDQRYVAIDLVQGILFSVSLFYALIHP